MGKIRVAVCGAAGRMGKTIIKMLSADPVFELCMAVEAPGTPLEGKDAGEVAGIGKIGVSIIGADKLEEQLHDLKPDVLVDFTTAKAAVENVKKACRCGVDVVVGTTGFTPEELQEIREVVRKHGVRAVVSPNMSRGVNVLFSLIKMVGSRLKDYDVEIVEAHHAMKKDMPSGTALKIGEILEKETGRRPRIHSIRAGEIVGEHRVLFAGPGERLEIIHMAQGREAFASGVLKVIKELKTKGKPGEVLGTQEIFGLE